MNYQEYELEDQNPYIEEDPNEDERQSNGSNVRQDEELVQTILVQYERTAKQCFESGRIDQGLDSFEKAIEQLATSVENGLDSPVFHAFFEKTISYLNQLALHSLQIDHLKEAFKILDKCSQWTHPERFGIFPALRSLTFNHLGCCYRRQGKVEKAQYHLEKALSFLQALDRVDISGMTHVNLCAIFSQKGE